MCLLSQTTFIPKVHVLHKIHFEAFDSPGGSTAEFCEIKYVDLNWIESHFIDQYTESEKS